MAGRNDDFFFTSNDNKKIINELIKNGKRDVPDFCEEGVNEIIYVPIQDGELKVYHHMPENNELKRPIFFVPGYVAAPGTWVNFHKPHHGLGEYYYFESREKTSSRIKRKRNVRLDLEQSAEDLVEVLYYLGLDKKDYILAGSSYGAGIITRALTRHLLNPPTTIAFDTITKWIYTNSKLIFLLRLLPVFAPRSLMMWIGKMYTKGMKNHVQKRRMLAFVEGFDPWKFKKSTLQNRKLDFKDDLGNIQNEVFICHGPLDKYHPRIEYYEYAKLIPKGRFIFMDTEDEERELLAGVIATEFAKITKNDGIPKTLKTFEIKISRD